jgi:hypothetical protein
VVERKLRPIGNRDRSVHFRRGIRLASDKSIKQLSGLAFELVQVGFFDKMAGRGDFTMSSFLGRNQPLRPVSARSGRKEFTGNQTIRSIEYQGDSVPSRGHGGVLVYTPMRA